MTRLIKRYGNRKLYDTRKSSYITLEGIAGLVRRGEDVRVIDNDSGEDLTALVFAQIIVEEEKRKSGILSIPVLRWIIREGEARIRELLARVDRGREAIENVRGMAERGVERLVQKGGRARQSLLGDILEGPQRQLDALQRQLDQQVRRGVQRLAGHPAVRSELERIKKTLRGLERQITKLQRQAAPVRYRRRGVRKLVPAEGAAKHRE